MKASKPVMLYFSSAPVRPDSIDQEQYEKLKKFKEECKSKGLIDTYESLSEFKEKLTRQLTLTIYKSDYFKLSYENIEYQESKNDDKKNTQTQKALQLSKEARELLIEASRDKDGIVMKLSVFGGMYVQTNGKKLNEQGNPRSEATWEAAVNELCEAGYLQDVGYKGEIFKLTHEGYRYADFLLLG